MQTNQLIPIPKLLKDNYNLWFDAVHIAATANGVQEHIISDPAYPDATDTTATQDVSSKRAIAQCIIMGSIPTNLLPELGHDIYSKTPYAICLHVKNTFDGSSPVDHALLAESARSITLADDVTIEDYVNKHTEMRTRMVAAAYPNIDDEVTTVMFMIEGLRGNPLYTNVGEQMITNPPGTVRDFSRTLLRLKNFRRLSSPRAPPIPPVFQAPPQQQFQNSYPIAARRSALMDYNQWQRPHPRRDPFPPRQQPYQPRQMLSKNVPRPPNYPPQAPWCHFHATWRHDASECRQLRRSGPLPNAMVAGATHASPMSNFYDQFQTAGQQYTPHDFNAFSTYGPTAQQIPASGLYANVAEGMPFLPPTLSSDDHAASGHAIAATNPQVIRTSANVDSNANENDVNDSSHYPRSLHETWYLDSGCYPSHLSAPGISHKNIIPHDYTITANGSLSPIQYIGPHTLQNQRTSLTVPQLALAPSFPKNLLSISQLCANHDVLFQKRAAYIIRPTKPPHPSQIIGIAPMTDGLYSLRLNTNRALPTCNISTLFGRTRKPIPSHLRQRPVPPGLCVQKPLVSTAVSPAPPQAPLSLRFTSSNDDNPAPHRQQNSSSLSPNVSSHTHTHEQVPPLPADSESMRWHLIMAHVQPSTLRSMASRNLVIGMPPSLPPLSAPLTCSACFVGKHSKAAHPPRPYPILQPGTYISSDTCGPVTPLSLNGFQHFLTFIDRASKFCIVKLIKSRAELATLIPATLNEIMNHHNRPIQVLLTDNAKEYSSKALTLYYGQAGIRYCKTVPHTPQENSAAERLNRTLFERARASLHAARLPNPFWGAAILDAADKYNKTLHMTTMKVPHTAWFGTKPDVSKLLPFGTKGYVAHVTSNKKRKLESRSHPCRYLQMTDDNHYLVYNITLERIVKCRTANFSQYHHDRDPTRVLPITAHSLLVTAPAQAKGHTTSLLPRTQAVGSELSIPACISTQDKPSSRLPNSTLHVSHTTLEQPSECAPDNVHRSKNTFTRHLLRLQPPVARSTPRGVHIKSTTRYASMRPHSSSTRARCALQPAPSRITASTPAPTTLARARLYPDSAQWRSAYREELDKLKKYDTFEPLPLTSIPRGTRILPLTTDFRYKRDAQNNLDKRKVRIELRGDLSQPFVHYDPAALATYALDKATARIIFSIAAAQNLSLRHIDIESAFLHERLDPAYPIYVKIPTNFDDSDQYSYSYARLKSNLYGSKQAGHTYYKDMKTFLASHGYNALASDSCVLTKHYPNGNYVLIGVTIDDFLVAATNPALVDDIKRVLSEKYTISDMGPPSQYIGWKVTRSPEGIHISQPAAIETLLEEFNMENCSPSLTPYCDGLLFEERQPDEPALDSEKYPYSRGVGLLRYIEDCTRPDIFHVTNSLARYLKDPTMLHWTQFKRVLRYLKGTITFGIMYTCHAAPLMSYSDSDFRSCPDTRRSTSGSLHLLNSAPISWNSKRQDTVALSTAEAEYIAGCHTAQHTKWLQQLLSEILPAHTRPTTLCVDNQGALKMALANGPTKRSKYVDIKYHYLREAVAQKAIELKYTPSTNMLADPFTKTLKPQKFLASRSRMNLCPVPSQ